MRQEQVFASRLCYKEKEKEIREVLFKYPDKISLITESKVIYCSCKAFISKGINPVQREILHRYLFL